MKKGVMWVVVALCLVFSPLILGLDSSKITEAEFERLSNGMSYSEAVDVIGGEGKLISESNMLGYRTVVYEWKGVGTLGANANVMFQNDRLINKAQAGLR